MASANTPPQSPVRTDFVDANKAQPKTLRVGIVTQYFPPDKPGSIPESIASSLIARGHAVKVLTTYPHYLTGRVSHGYRQRLHTDERIGPMQVRRVPLIPSHSRNPIGRILNYVSFAASARLSKRFLKDVDVVYVHGTPATVAEPARSLAKSSGIPYVYHVQDIWPESVTESGFLPQRMLPIVNGVINKWLSSVYRRAAAVISIAPIARELLVTRGAPSERTHMVYNWAESQETTKRTYKSGLSLLYAGSLGDFQDLDTVIQAAKSLADYPDFRMRIAGSGIAEQRLRRLVRDLELDGTVEFLGSVDKEQMKVLYAEADFQIVPLKKLQFFAGTIPSKFQAGLAHGTPVITTVMGDVSRIVRENDLGFTAEPENPESLASAIASAYALSVGEKAEYSNRAREFFDKNFRKETAMDKIESILFEAQGMSSQRNGVRQ